MFDFKYGVFKGCQLFGFKSDCQVFLFGREVADCVIGLIFIYTFRTKRRALNNKVHRSRTIDHSRRERGRWYDRVGSLALMETHAFLNR